MRSLIWVLALVMALPALAQQREVDLELVLMADSSGSITMDEIRFQRAGYAQALRDPDVVAAIAETAYGRIALTYVEWGQFDSQDVVVPWTVIEDAGSAAAFATALMEAPRRARGRNSIGAALLFGKAMIEENDIDGWRRIIDFSADSTGNFNGPSIEEGRAHRRARCLRCHGGNPRYLRRGGETQANPGNLGLARRHRCRDGVMKGKPGALAAPWARY